MKKLLYIIANSKPEEISSSQQVAREFVNQFMKRNPEYSLEELNLFHDNIPEPNHYCFESRAKLISGEKYEALTAEQKDVVNRMQALCDQFKRADRIVIAAPMWTLTFPYRMKQWIDCIILNNQTISISEAGVKGLLRGKQRKAIYIQASASMFPFSTIKAPFLGARVNHGVTYIRDVFHFVGFSRVYKLLVEGTEIDIGTDVAIQRGLKKVPKLVKRFE